MLTATISLDFIQNPNQVSIARQNRSRDCRLLTCSELTCFVGCGEAYCNKQKCGARAQEYISFSLKKFRFRCDPSSLINLDCLTAMHEYCHSTELLRGEESLWVLRNRDCRCRPKGQNSCRYLDTATASCRSLDVVVRCGAPTSGSQSQLERGDESCFGGSILGQSSFSRGELLFPVEVRRNEIAE